MFCAKTWSLQKLVTNRDPGVLLTEPWMTDVIFLGASELPRCDLHKGQADCWKPGGFADSQCKLKRVTLEWLECDTAKKFGEVDMLSCKAWIIVGFWKKSLDGDWCHLNRTDFLCAEEWVEWVPNSSDMVVSSCCELLPQMTWESACSSACVNSVNTNGPGSFFRSQMQSTQGKNVWAAQ